MSLLRRRASKEEGWKKCYIGGRKSTFNENLETELVQHIKKMESMFFELTTNDVRKLAFQIAEAKQISHRFSTKTKMAIRYPYHHLRVLLRLEIELLTKCKLTNTFKYFLECWININSCRMIFGI